MHSYTVNLQKLGREIRCLSQSLQPRAATPGFPFLPIPLPKPVVLPDIFRPITPINPVAFPPVPKPVAPVPPKPVEPVEPAPPKPVEPAPLKPIDPALPKPVEPDVPKPQEHTFQCKRVPGGACSNIAPFEDPGLEIFRFKGSSSQAALVAAQRSDVVRDVDRPSVSTNYVYQSYKETPPIDEEEAKFLVQDPVNIHYTTESKWTKSFIHNKDNQNPKTDNMILTTYQDKEQRGMIIEDSRNKENDLAPPQDMLRWSDMVMFNLRDTFGEEAPTLHYMIQNNIAGGSSAAVTQHLIENAIKRTHGDRTKVNTFRSDPDAPGITSDELAAYQLIAGSDHADRVLKMLADYPATMKNVRIERFDVATTDTVGATDEYVLIIKFTKVDNP